MRRERVIFALLVAASLSARAGPAAAGAELPAGFVDVEQWIPTLRADLRYAGSDNFVGRPVAGYESARVILSEPAARALRDVQAELAPYGLGLLVYDAYRPARAVADFVRWAEEPGDSATKARFYPDVEKRTLIPEGYIAARSSHSRGSTLDVTLVALGGDVLDMGGGFDLFSPRSWPTSPDVPAAARANRLLLRTLMTKHGFAPYAQEWWHFTLEHEPFPDRYFDFPVR